MVISTSLQNFLFNKSFSTVVILKIDFKSHYKKTIFNFACLADKTIKECKTNWIELNHELSNQNDNLILPCYQTMNFILFAQK